MRYTFSIIVLLAVIFSSCLETNQKFSKLPPGIWRGVLKLDPGVNMVAIEEEVGTSLKNEGDLPFMFEVIYDDADQSKFHIEIINGDERLPVNDIIYGLDRKTAKDTIIFNFPVFDTYIKALYEESVIEGDWFVNYKNGYSIPFKAYYGRDYRFPNQNLEPTENITGKWDVTFEPEEPSEYPAIGQFEQNGNQLSGTFKTETGDFRYLEGTVQGNKFYLSTFDGSHAFLFTGKILEDGTLLGSFRSGKHYTCTWVANRNEEATLSDPYALTTDLTGGEAIDFSFINTDGKMISLSDEAYNGKIKLVQIMGTWCPNCKDETKFLLDYLASEQPKDIEVIAIGFERYPDQDKNIAALNRFKSKWNVPYEVLLGGNSPDKAEAKLKMPQLSDIISYPTLLFIDSANTIRYIHTGFAGPATDDYTAFKTKFKENIAKIRGG